MNVCRFLLGLSGFGVAILFFVQALEYPSAAAQMPFIFSVAVALLSISMVLIELVNRLSNAENKVETNNNSAVVNSKGKIFAALIFCLALGYVAVLNTLGYALSTIMFMALSLLLVKNISLKGAVAGVVVLVSIVSLIFIVFLGLSIPLLPEFSSDLM